MPNLFMLVGVPGAGKSTWCNALKKRIPMLTVSTDDYIQSYADRVKKTYSEVFQSVIKEATKQMTFDASEALRNDRDFIWDQTNLNVKSRALKLQSVPLKYIRHAVVFHADPKHDRALIDQRILSRKGKFIDKNIIDRMFSMFEMPSISEGFDFIRIINVRDQQ